MYSVGFWSFEPLIMVQFWYITRVDYLWLNFLIGEYNSHTKKANKNTEKTFHLEDFLLPLNLASTTKPSLLPNVYGTTLS